MDINNNTNITSQIAQSISKLNLNTAQRAFRATEKSNQENSQEIEKIKQEDVALIDENDVKNKVKSPIDVNDIQKYASQMGENLTIEDINYGLMYGRSVIAEFIA
ncbi:MAG: hypothetical protein IJ003_05060 [Candidatus Gastranaerophilales bacterium]|nr:hypothetical protein [Candidatus Gastranaerophilales bacterium]